MRKDPLKFFEKSGITLTGEALNLLRTAPPGVTAAYVLGTVPMTLAALYFWADMSRSAFAYERCFGFSLALALLFAWMKTWQAVFADGLKAHITGTPAAPWTLRRWLRQAAIQTALQPYGILAIPFAFLLMIPFPYVHAFYQNLTVLGPEVGVPLRDTVRKAWRQATLWPMQNSLVMWLSSPWLLAIGVLTVFGTVRLALSMTPEVGEAINQGWVLLLMLVLIGTLLLPFSIIGCIVAGNIALLLIWIPHLLRFLFGVETVFTLGGTAIFNSTFVATVFGLSYLCMDPLLKAAHVLRCFYGESQKNGEDLLVELRSIREQAPGPAAPASVTRP